MSIIRGICLKQANYYINQILAAAQAHWPKHKSLIQKEFKNNINNSEPQFNIFQKHLLQQNLSVIIFFSDFITFWHHCERILFDIIFLTVLGFIELYRQCFLHSSYKFLPQHWNRDLVGSLGHCYTLIHFSFMLNIW